MCDCGRVVSNAMRVAAAAAAPADYGSARQTAIIRIKFRAWDSHLEHWHTLPLSLSGECARELLI